jgi:hypothetical protein
MSSGARPHSELWGNPYSFIGPRLFREARVRAYIVREHRRGRALDEILSDPYIARCGSPALVAKVLEAPETIAALAADAYRAIESDRL